MAFSVLLRGALPPTVVVGAVSSAVVALVAGLSAGVSALVGVAIVVAFFASGLLAVSRIVVDTSNPMLFMAVGMAVYFMQVIVLFGVLVAARNFEAFDSRAAAIVMLLCILTWQAGQMVAWHRARVPVYDGVSLPSDSAPEQGSGWIDHQAEVRIAYGPFQDGRIATPRDQGSRSRPSGTRPPLHGRKERL